MNGFKKIICFIFFLIVFVFLNPQNIFSQKYPRKDIDIDAFIQDLFNQNQQESDVNYEDLYESLFQLYTQPLNLNDANRDELNNLYILSQEQVNNFLNYRKRNGNLLSIYELQSIPGFDINLINKILPFVEVEDNKLDTRPLKQKVFTEKNHYFLLRESRILQTQKGFLPADTSSTGRVTQRYLGSPDKIYARYRVSHSHDYSFGFTTEKDAGEQMKWDSKTKFMDFWSFHGQLQNRGNWKNIVVGDYLMQFGQGLVLSAGFSVGKGAETITTIRRNNLGIRPYSSALESGFFRGAAATYNFGKFDLTAFVSQIKRDASLTLQKDTTDEIETFVGSLQLSGKHRTNHELAAKNSILERSIGGNILYKSDDKNLEIGFTYLTNIYDQYLQHHPRVYNQYDFKGKQNAVTGANFSYNFQNFNFFGEIARSSSGGTGMVGGFVSSLTSKIEFSMLLRRYDKNFHSFYANAFGENTNNNNEKGVYWGLKFTPTRKWQMSAYYDKFSFPWLKYLVSAPSNGYEYLLRLSFKPSKTILLYAQFREENKGRNIPPTISLIDIVAPALRRNYIFNIDFAATKNIFLRSRVQFSNYTLNERTTGGYAIIQDVNFESGRWQLSTRLALFDTDDYNNRQYVYEKDVLYSFSLPAYYERGIRSYLMLQYKLFSKASIWLRYAQTDLRNVKKMGSGLDLINGQQKSEIKCQLMIFL